ncbi:MAG: glycosidase [Clostridia bacterium]|nr:glycosidase [Clostridia bacterium]
MLKRKIIDCCDLKPSDERFEVIGAFNPAVVSVGGTTYMILRVAEKAKQTKKGSFLVPYFKPDKGLDILSIPLNEDYDFSDVRVIRRKNEFYLTSMSHFRIGRSSDGINFDFSENICIFPQTDYEEYGIEDARITAAEGVFYVTYTAVNRKGTFVALMTTKDFRHFERKGVLFSRDDKDCVIFPDKINGKYYAMHRPSTEENQTLDIFTAESDDLINWTSLGALTGARLDFTSSARLGAGAVPIKTEKGYLEIYHSADENNRYFLAAMLLDPSDPTKVLAKSKSPLIEPTKDYEKTGFVNEVVFTCGLTKTDDALNIYYGVCDLGVAVAYVPMSKVWDNMEVK